MMRITMAKIGTMSSIAVPIGRRNYRKEIVVVDFGVVKCVHGVVRLLSNL